MDKEINDIKSTLVRIQEKLCNIHLKLLSHINNVWGENIYDLQNNIQDISDLIDKIRKENHDKHKICAWAEDIILNLEIVIENMDEEDNMGHLEWAEKVLVYVINSINTVLYSSCNN